MTSMMKCNRYLRNKTTKTKGTLCSTKESNLRQKKQYQTALQTININGGYVKMGMIHLLDDLSTYL